MKFPQPCEALSAIRPVQIVGGEQTLFAVTSEGKVCSPENMCLPFHFLTLLDSFLVVFSLTLFQSWPKAVCKFAFEYLKIPRDPDYHGLGQSKRDARNSNVTIVTDFNQRFRVQNHREVTCFEPDYLYRDYILNE